MRKKEELIIRCIEDIRAGKSSPEECLQAYPDQRQELEPLLSLSLGIRERDAVPSDEFRIAARAALMRHIRERQADSVTAGRTSRSYGSTIWSTGWSRAVAVSLTVIIILAAAGTGTAYASRSSIPGDSLYPVKIAAEQVQRIVTFDAEAEVELEMKFADIRLDELAEVTALPDESALAPLRIVPMSVNLIHDAAAESFFMTKTERIDRAIAGYEKNLNLALEKSKNIEDNEALLEKIALTVLNHFEKLDTIEDNASPAAREAIVRTREVIIDGHVRSVQNLAEVDPVKAKEINEQAILNRSERAAEQSSQGQSQKAENALKDMEKLKGFGKEKTDSGNSRENGPKKETGNSEDQGGNTSSGSENSNSSFSSNNTASNGNSSGRSANAHGKPDSDQDESGNQPDKPAGSQNKPDNHRQQNSADQ
jgi:hypothetical protein